MQLPKVYLIHECADKKDAAARAAKDVFRSERVRKRVRVEPGTLVGNANDQRLPRGLERRGDVLVRIVGVAMQYRVYRGLADGHGHVRDGVLVEACPLGRHL